MVESLCWLETGCGAYAVNTSRFGGLGMGGLVVVIVVGVILIAAVVWLINGTGRHD